MVNDGAWQTLVAALGGVAVTASFGLLTAYLTHRWQLDRLKQETRLVLDREMRSARRETYARYIASANKVFNLSFDNYPASRGDPKDSALVALDPPASLLTPLGANEAMRVEVMLLAGPSVRSALHEYAATLKRLWPVVASGATTADQPASTAAYHHLIEAMQQEIAES
jgi:hypothetical protein